MLEKQGFINMFDGGLVPRGESSVILSGPDQGS